MTKFSTFSLYLTKLYVTLKQRHQSHTAKSEKSFLTVYVYSIDPFSNWWVTSRSWRTSSTRTWLTGRRGWSPSPSRTGSSAISTSTIWRWERTREKIISDKKNLFLFCIGQKIGANIAKMSDSGYIKWNEKLGKIRFACAKHLIKIFISLTYCFKLLQQLPTLFYIPHAMMITNKRRNPQFCVFIITVQLFQLGPLFLYIFIRIDICIRYIHRYTLYLCPRIRCWCVIDDGKTLDKQSYSTISLASGVKETNTVK